MIVFPMAGASSRFTLAGYDKPKFMLPVGNGYVFDYAVRGMMAAEQDEDFIFIHREESGVRDFILARCEAIGVHRPQTIALAAPTRGQAETVEIGVRSLGACQGPLWIFNIDTFRSRRPFLAPVARGDGYLEVFRGHGDNWSFVLPASHDNRVQMTTEKNPVSDLCCNGMYHFGDVGSFLYAIERERAEPTCSLGELYVAPIYNHLIRAGKDVRYDIIDIHDIVFCGTPSEYEHVVCHPCLIDMLY